MTVFFFLLLLLLLFLPWNDYMFQDYVVFLFSRNYCAMSMCAVHCIMQHCVQHSIYFRNVVTKFLFFFPFLFISACLACFILKCYCIVCWPLFCLFFLFLQCIDCIILRLAIGKLDTFLDEFFNVQISSSMFFSSFLFFVCVPSSFDRWQLQRQ